MKTITRIIKVPCPHCWGTTASTNVVCDTCQGKGEVDRRVVEVVHDEEDKDVDVMQRNAGAHA